MKRVIYLTMALVLLLGLLPMTVAAQAPEPTLSSGNVSAVTAEPYGGPNAVLYDQTDNDSGDGWTSQDFEAAYDASDSQLADDFVIPAADGAWAIDEVYVAGQYWNGPGGPAPTVNVFFYQDAGGLPGAEVYNTNLAPSVDNFGAFTIALPAPVILTAGAYWVSVQARMDFQVGGQWGWNSRTVQSFNLAAWRNPGDGFGSGCTDWRDVVTCFGRSEPDQIFRLAGSIYVPPGEPAQLTTSLATCQQYKAGTAPDLSAVRYHLNFRDKISLVTPLSVAYFTGVTAPNAGFFDIMVVQGNDAGLPALTTTMLGVAVYDQNCRLLSRTTAPVQMVGSNVRVNFPSRGAGAQYYVKVKYNTTSLLSAPVTPGLIANYTFSTAYDDLAPFTGDSLQLIPK